MNRGFTFMNRNELVYLAILAAFILVVLPLGLDIFRLNLFGKYLTYAFVAMGLVLCWGMGGILSLGQGVYFGLGGYCMAMFLKLEASTPEATASTTAPYRSRNLASRIVRPSTSDCGDKAASTNRRSARS